MVDVIDAGLALRRFTPGDLKLVLETDRPCRGAGRLAEVMADDTAMAISRSRAEQALLRLIRDAGYDVLRPTRAHVIYEGLRVLVLLTQALSR